MTSNFLSCYECTAKFLTGAALIVVVLGLCFSSLALAITDIVIGATWQSCYLNDDNADIYLIVNGSLLLAGVFLFTNSKKNTEAEVDGAKGFISLVMAASLGVLIWGMTIVWDTEKGDCDTGQYNYLYYRTVVVMFIQTAIVALLILYLICAGGAVFAMT
jgi:hypothetical protein